jgi:hypothetical protein
MALTPQELKDFALNPKKAKNENGEMEMHDLDDMIKLSDHQDVSNGSALKRVCGGTIVNRRGTR